MDKLLNASKIKQCSFMILVRTHLDYMDLFDFASIPDNLRIIDSYEVEMRSLLKELSSISERMA